MNLDYKISLKKTRMDPDLFYWDFIVSNKRPFRKDGYCSWNYSNTLKAIYPVESEGFFENYIRW